MSSFGIARELGQLRPDLRIRGTSNFGEAESKIPRQHAKEHLGRPKRRVAPTLRVSSVAEGVEVIISPATWVDDGCP